MGLMNIRRMIMNSAPQEEPQTATVGPSAIATFDANWAVPMKSVKVNIDPVQDLHGQDSPYPAGGGKNKLDAAPFTANTGVNYRHTFPNPVALKVGTYTLSWTQSANITSNTRNTPYYILDGNYKYDITTGNNHLGSGQHSWTFTISDDVTVTFGYWANAIDVECTYSNFMVELGSTATDYAPYENICPISGRTEVNAEHSGKNIFGGEVLRDGVLASMSSATDDAENRYVSFTASATAAQGITVGAPFKENTAYTFIFDLNCTTSNTNLRVLYTDGTREPLPTVTANTRTKLVFVSNSAKTIDSLIKTNQGGTTRIYYDESGIFEGVLTATSYEPYAGQSINIQLGQTVYGGKLDVVSGELVIDRADVDLGTLNWKYSSVRDFFYVNLTGIKYSATMISSMYKSVGIKADSQMALEPTGTIGQTLNSEEIKIRNTNYTNATAFKTAMSGVQLCYELATPITITLTPHEIRSYLGGNNVWADTGDSTVEYRADPTLYIQRKIAEALS